MTSASINIIHQNKLKANLKGTNGFLNLEQHGFLTKGNWLVSLLPKIVQ